MTATTVPIAVPRKGRPLEAVLERLAARTDTCDLADSIASTLRYEKAVAKGDAEPDESVYDRLATYSATDDETAPEFTLVRDDRAGKPRRIVFDSVTIHADDVTLELVGREEPFRALRKHEFSLGFDSADLVLEGVVGLGAEPLARIDDLNRRIDPQDTDVRVVTGLGDTVYHTLMATPATLREGPAGELTRAFVAEYEGSLCISPRYERLVQAILGTDATDAVSFCYPRNGQQEEAAIADAGLGIYLSVTGSTARGHGLVVGEELFPSETVLMENLAEATSEPAERAKAALTGVGVETALTF